MQTINMRIKQLMIFLYLIIIILGLKKKKLNLKTKIKPNTVFKADNADKLRCGLKRKLG